MGLKWLRDQFKHLKIILWAVVAVFVLLVFVDWGAGRSGGPSGSIAAVTVGDVEISEQVFLREVRRTRDRFQQIYGDSWEQVRDQLDLAGITAQQIIRRELTLAEAKRLGLVVSQQELQEEILSIPVFQREGGGFVGPETYERILRANRMTVEEFETDLADDLMVRKLATLMERGVYVSDAEVEKEYRREREVSDLEVALFREQDFLAGQELNDAEIQSHYDQSGEEFLRQEQRVVRYLAVETMRLRRLLPVEDAELEIYYQEHRDEFLEGEEAHVRHILFRLAPNATDGERSEARLRAEAVVGMARGGADFAALAAKHSDDPATKDIGGDLSFIRRGTMDPRFDEAVFGAQAGDILGPVESQHGFHVIVVEELREERHRPLDEVRDQVRFSVLEGRAAAEAEQRARALAGRLQEEKPTTDEEWQQIADEDEAVALNISPAFGRDESIPGIGQVPDLVDEVFSAAEGDIGDARAIARGWMVWQLREVKPEGVAPLEDVRDQVAQQLRQAKALSAAIAKGQELAERWRAGEDQQAAADELGATVIPAQEHRRGAPIAGLGPAPALDRAVYGAGEGDVVGPVEITDTGAAIARVVRLVRITPEELEADKETTRTRLASQRGGQLLDAVINQRQRDTTVVVDPEVVARFAPRSDG